jgi:hypothetical protein
LEFQLRDYTIREGELEDFVREWTAGVVPLRRRFGFKIVGAWQQGTTNRFVWILGYDGPDGFEREDAAYYSSEERLALSPDPAKHVAKSAHTMMKAVLGP